MHQESVIIIRIISLFFAVLSLVGILYLVKTNRYRGWASVLPILLLLNTGAYYIDRILCHGYGFNLIPISAEDIHTWSLIIRLQATLTIFAVIALHITDEYIHKCKKDIE